MGGRSNCARITKGEIVSKWFLCCSCLVFSNSFVHDCKTAKCFQNQRDSPAWKLEPVILNRKWHAKTHQGMLPLIRRV